MQQSLSSVLKSLDFNDDRNATEEIERFNNNIDFKHGA